MKNKKAFTLIELLAVLVILTNLAFITTPIVLNVIKNAREEATERSADAYVRALDNAVTTCLSKYPNIDVNDMTLINNGNKIVIGTNNECKVEFKGKI